MPNGPTNPWSQSNSSSLRQNQGDSAGRDKRVNTIGNLTLVTKSLNGALSNRPWTDSQATGLKDGGQPGQGKRSLLDGFSLLVLNKEILQDHEDSWDDNDIVSRSKHLVEAICEIWHRPTAY